MNRRSFIRNAITALAPMVFVPQLASHFRWKRPEYSCLFIPSPPITLYSETWTATLDLYEMIRCCYLIKMEREAANGGLIEFYGRI